MKKNMGSTDQMIRIGTAILISLLYISNFISDSLEIILLPALGILLVTSFFSFCPLYLPFGITTMKKSKYKKRTY